MENRLDPYCWYYTTAKQFFNIQTAHTVSEISMFFHNKHTPNAK